jgi:hypothetical protein
MICLIIHTHISFVIYILRFFYVKKHVEKFYMFNLFYHVLIFSTSSLFIRFLIFFRNPFIKARLFLISPSNPIYNFFFHFETHSFNFFSFVNVFIFFNLTLKLKICYCPLIYFFILILTLIILIAIFYIFIIFLFNPSMFHFMGIGLHNLFMYSTFGLMTLVTSLKS